ncbi:hypothetical protein L798_04421 [Zootermopsis nevadensis]|uniref:Uncharacterized protein n=1 Tax=Zootermopsis nevadensis TaxID=136037 RepID=A0A067QQ37_ZOONE|nr:hypothetical protein L798_04421 [Zootermopsis nevadensis]
MPRLPSCVNESQSVDKDLRMECIVHLYASGNNTEICTYIAPGLIPIQTHGTETSY